MFLNYAPPALASSNFKELQATHFQELRLLTQSLTFLQRNLISKLRLLFSDRLITGFTAALKWVARVYNTDTIWKKNLVITTPEREELD